MRYSKMSKRQKRRNNRMKTKRQRGGQSAPPSGDVVSQTVAQADEPVSGPLEKVNDIASGLVGTVTETATGLVGTVTDKATGLVGTVTDKATGLVGTVTDKASGLATTALSTATHLAEKPLEQGIGIINASLSNKELVDQTTDTVGKVSDVASTIVEESTPLVTATIKSAGEVAGQAATEFGKSFGKLAVGAVTEIPGANMVVGTLKMGDGLFGMVGSAFSLGSGIIKTSSGLVGNLAETTKNARGKISSIMSRNKSSVSQTTQSQQPQQPSSQEGGFSLRTREKQEIITRIGGAIRAFKDTDHTNSILKHMQTKKNTHGTQNKTKRVRFML